MLSFSSSSKKCYNKEINRKGDFDRWDLIVARKNQFLKRKRLYGAVQMTPAPDG